MPWWILVTLVAAVLQIIRTGLQKALKQDLDDYAVTWARYGFALPWVLLWLVAVWLAGIDLPSPTAGFWWAAGAAAVLQIVATVMLLALFDMRNFAVCTAFAKTEAAQIAVLGFLFFGETMSALGVLGVTVGGIGVLLMLPLGKMANGRVRWHGRATVLGLGAGMGFAFTALFIRQAIAELGDGNPLILAGMTLSVMVVLQATILGLVLWWRGQPRRAVWWRLWRPAAWVGLTSVLGSWGWATAFALTNPAFVKTLAQVELPLAYWLGRAAFREKLRPMEIIGMGACAIAAILVAFA